MKRRLEILEVWTIGFGEPKEIYQTLIYGLDKWGNGYVAFKPYEELEKWKSKIGETHTFDIGKVVKEKVIVHKIEK